MYSTMHPEKYSLTWPTYPDHLKSMMKELMMNEDFSDVTLVTEDKKHLKANMNILSACSPVFKDLLKKEKNSNTIMYLRGIQFSEMESILQFVYLGEATFYKERMNEFLMVAKSLEIKDLCNEETETTDEPEQESSATEEGTFNEKLKEQTAISNHSERQVEPSGTEEEGAFYENLKEQTVVSDHAEIQFPKEAQRRVFRVNGKYECSQCKMTFEDTKSLHCHKKSDHNVAKYPCGQCDHQFSQIGILTRHIHSKHVAKQGVKYSCAQCDYQTTRHGHFTRHNQSRLHEIKTASILGNKTN